VDDETLVKMLALIKGKDPLPDQILGLRELTAEELRAGVGTLQEALGRMRAFLREEFNIHGLDYIPYEGQLLALSLVFSDWNELDNQQRDALVRWIWVVEFSEAMKKARPSRCPDGEEHQADYSGAGRSLECQVAFGKA
jgi:hypothetical protein